MRILSATECISPAIERTKLILYSPFRKGRTWKLCATSYLTMAGTMFFPFPLIYLALIPAVRGAGSWAVVAVVVAVLIFSAVFTWIFHLCSKIQFAYFDIVVNRGEFVAPAWRKYRGQTLPWTGFKILFGAVLTLICAAPIAAYIRHLVPIFRELPTITPGQPPPPQFVAAIAGIYAGYFVVGFLFSVVYLISSLLANFIVPSLALEDTGLKEAFRRLGELIRREPGEFTIFVLLKIGLGIAAYMGATILWELAFLLVTLLIGLVVLLLGFLLHLAGVPIAVLTVLGIFLAIAWYFFGMVYVLLLAIGPAFTFLDAYALYFLGGRYPMLGDLLDRSAPPPPQPAFYPPAAPYQAYPPPPA